MLDISEKELVKFESEGWLIFPSFVSTMEAAALREILLSQVDAGEMKKAGIGRESGFMVNPQRRGDFIQWIDPAHSPAPTQRLLDLLGDLMRSLNRHFYLGLQDWECHYTHYPAGTRYERHVDRHQDGSARVISFVLYLNENWNPLNGGQLMLYPPHKEPVEIEPREGTLAVFLSETEHEVLLTSTPRLSITGWMRTYSGTAVI